MRNTVYKFRPSDYWRIGEHESWFAEMAAEGFYLQKIGIHFAKFVKREPNKMRYRIDVSRSKKVPAEQIHMYAESGWDFVTSYGQFHVYSSPAELNAPELHTDPAEQSYTLKKLDKKLAWNAVVVIISMIVMIGLLVSTWLLDGTPVLFIVEGMIIQQTTLAIFMGYTAYNSLQAALSIRALRKSLVEGKAIDHHASWKKHHRVNTVAAFLFSVVVGLSAIIPFMQLIKMDTKTLPEASQDLPIVRLTDVEKNPDLVRPEAEYTSDNVDWGNRYSYYWSPLAPIHYETDENGVVPGKMWRDGSGEYSPSLRTHVYQLTISSLAENLVWDLVERYRYENEPNEYVEKKHPALDLLILHEEEEKKEVFAAKGNAVMYVQYYGYTDVNSLIENVAKKITMITD